MRPPGCLGLGSVGLGEFHDLRTGLVEKHCTVIFLLLRPGAEAAPLFCRMRALRNGRSAEREAMAAAGAPRVVCTAWGATNPENKKMRLQKNGRGAAGAAAPGAVFKAWGLAPLS